MGPVESVATSLTHYAKFSGRATRSEFWWFQIFYAVCFYASHSLGDMLQNTYEGINGMTLGAVMNLVLILPMLSVQVRRLHDVGWSGVWVLAFYGSAMSVVIVVGLTFATASLMVLLILLAYSALVLLLMLTVMFQYVRGSNPNGEIYGAARMAEQAPEIPEVQSFAPQEFVPQSYIPQPQYIQQSYASYA